MKRISINFTWFLGSTVQDLNSKEAHCLDSGNLFRRHRGLIVMTEMGSNGMISFLSRLLHCRTGSEVGCDRYKFRWAVGCLKGDVSWLAFWGEDMSPLMVIRKFDSAIIYLKGDPMYSTNHFFLVSRLQHMFCPPLSCQVLVIFMFQRWTMIWLINDRWGKTLKVTRNNMMLSFQLTRCDWNFLGSFPLSLLHAAWDRCVLDAGALVASSSSNSRCIWLTSKM